MSELLQYDFTVVGMDNVERALASLERRFAQHNAKQNAMFGGTRGTRAGGGNAAVATATNAATREQVAALKKVEREAIASAKRVERERVSSEKAVAREQQKQEQYWAKARQQSRAVAQQEIRDLAEARATFVKSTVGKGFGRVLSGVRAVGTAGLALTGVGGAAIAASSVSQAIDLDERARRISIASRDNGEAGADPNELRKAFTTTGIKYGLAPEDIAAGVQSYVSDTGDLKTAMANRDTFAAVSQGEDAKMPEVFSTAAALTQSMDVKTVKEMADAFAILATQGKKGSFEIRNMAQYLPEVLATAATSGAKGTRGVRDVGALMQIGMRATHDAAETATSSNAIFRQLNAKSGAMASGAAFSGRKVHVFENDDPTKNMLPFSQVLQDSISASRGNVGQLNEVFDARGVKNLLPMINAYKDANNAQGGGKKGDEAGRAAVKTMFESFSEVSGDFSMIERDASDAMKSVNAQLAIFNSELKDAVASELFPEIVKLTPQLKELIPAVVQLTKGVVSAAQFFAEHPFAGLGAAVASSILYEIASASIGKLIAGAVTQSLAAGTAAQLAAGGGAGGLLAGGRAALNGGGALGTVGAAGLAAVGVTAAVLSEQDLAKSTGGQGGVWAGTKSFFSGDGFFKGVDDFQNQQAKDDRKTADAMPQDPAVAQAAKDQVTAATKQAATVDKFAVAVDKLSGLSPNRGNSPSPVKN